MDWKLSDKETSETPLDGLNNNDNRCSHLCSVVSVGLSVAARKDYNEIDAGK